MLCAATLLLAPRPTLAQAPGGSAAAGPLDAAVLDAREALRKKDKPRLAALRQQLMAAQHPLALWADYWDLGLRLAEATPAEVDTVLQRWPGSYVEDRLRNDWLLELGRRRDWATFAREHPRYRMNDDREVACYALLLQHQAGQDVRQAARTAWFAQRDLDDGCHLLASTLVEARQLSTGDVWREMRLSVEANRPRAARAAAALVGATTAKAVAELLDQPARLLKRHVRQPSAQHQELVVLALMRLAATEPDAAAAELDAHWDQALDAGQAAAAWAVVAKQAALRQLPQAHDWFQQAWKQQRNHGHAPTWSDDSLAWSVRAALRAPRLDRERWGAVLQGIAAMSADELRDPAWTWWKARALKARARSGSAGDADREQAQALLQALAVQSTTFHGQLAAAELGQPLALPATPAPFTDAEHEQAATHPGLKRGLQLAQLGLRDEGRREWNFSLRGMADRELLAAAQLACQAQDWQLCINTSERSRTEVDLRQRYPQPYAAEITARAQERALEPAFVFGLIRQETRFMAQLRSSAGASGLMQLMPATARWTARKVGIDLRNDVVTDIDTNLRLGTTYLKLVLDDFAGSQALAAAAYNAGPGRPRRWREGPVLDAAAWAENIPFNETRDYVKKVLANATVYNHLLGGAVQPLKGRLGSHIGPREATAPAPDGNLP